jgi:hypothetical protein
MSIPMGLRVGTSNLGQLLSCCTLLHFNHVDYQAMWQFSKGVCENSVAGSVPVRTQLLGIDRGLAMRNPRPSSIPRILTNFAHEEQLVEGRGGERWPGV